MVLHPLMDICPDPSTIGSGKDDGVAPAANNGPPQAEGPSNRSYLPAVDRSAVAPKLERRLGGSPLIGPQNPMTPHVFEQCLVKDTTFYLPNGTQIKFKGGTTLLRRRSDASLYMGVLAENTTIGGWIYKAGTPIRIDSGDEPEAGVLAEGNKLDGNPVPEGTKIIVMEGKGDPLFTKTGQQAVKQLHLPLFAAPFSINGKPYHGVVVFDPHTRMPTHICDNFMPVKATDDDPLASFPVDPDKCVASDDYLPFSGYSMGIGVMYDPRFNPERSDNDPRFNPERPGIFPFDLKDFFRWPK